jgi:alginate O-acetyltransferase complex protein AlgI
MLADPLGKIVDPIYQRAVTGPLLEGQGWLATAFAFQVFFDFAGYSDIAIGLGLIFGIALPRNFDGPFRTTSMVDFWQRWHMTLARFLRDYVFTPLSRISIGGGRHRMTRALFAILLTMALCGLWHGAGWTFILWGTLQGVAIVFAAVWPRYIRSPPAFVGWAATVGFFLITIVLFRAPSLDAAWNVYGGMANLPGSANGFRTMAIAALCAIALPPSHVIVTRLAERPNGYVPVALAAATLVVLLQILRSNNHEFIYFQF